MPRKTMVEAIRDAMDVSMQRDDNVVEGQREGQKRSRCDCRCQQRQGYSLEQHERSRAQVERGLVQTGIITGEARVQDEHDIGQADQRVAKRHAD